MTSYNEESELMEEEGEYGMGTDEVMKSVKKYW